MKTISGNGKMLVKYCEVKKAGTKMQIHDGRKFHTTHTLQTGRKQQLTVVTSRFSRQ